MASRFHEITVKDIHKTTPDCSVVSFQIPDNLKNEFSFTQGQYLTLKAQINGENVQRSYSLCSCPHDDAWQVGIKKIPGGLFSTYANDVLKVGDKLEAMVPNGNFFVDVEPKAERNFIAIAAGSGITPIYSIIKTHLENEPKSSFKLLYTNQTAGSVILKEEIEGLKNRFMDRLEVFHFLTKQSRGIDLYDGRLNEEKLEKLCNAVIDVNQIDHIFSCGPEEMIFMAKDFFMSKGVSERKIHFELFTSAAAKRGPKREVNKELKGMVSDVTILDGGKSFNFKIHQGSNNILDAALANSADLPYACKGGVCSTCKAKVIEGKVDMEVNYALEPEEVEAGYILTCQAHPCSEKVVVDFDN
ncbi:MAG: 1,2-phenylacetyl-CoA epoxidase subunit PaaE [Flavobacteriales bacterium]